MLDGCVLRLVAFEFHKVDVYLQRSVRQQPYQVGFGCYLQWHEVENDNLQWPYVLRCCPRIVYYKDVLILENVDGGQLIRQS